MLHSTGPTGKPTSRPDLSQIVDMGAGVRRHRFLHDLGHFLPAALVAAIGQCLIYVGVVVSAGRMDWHNTLFVCAALCAAAILTPLLLVTMRRQQFPITVAAISSVVIFNFAVVALSGLRIPISYIGLFAAVPVLVAAMVYANVRFHRHRRDKVGLLDFPGADEAAQLLGGNIAIVHLDDENVLTFEKVLIDPHAHHSEQWTPFITRLYMLGVEVQPWVQYYEGRRGRVVIEAFDLSHLAYSPSQIYYSKAKRIIDVAAALILLPFAIPVGILIAIYIVLIDGSPAVFVQDRRGYGGRSFRMFKFRTMRRGTEGGATQTDDDRILPGCKMLRLFRLDELPQLVNILKGDMSWIGPRPVSVEIAESIEARLPQYFNRQLVLPGLTGWAQVNQGYASNEDQEIEKLSYDLYYVKNMSFDLDLLIVFKTIATLLLRSGAK